MLGFLEVKTFSWRCMVLDKGATQLLEIRVPVLPGLVYLPMASASRVSGLGA